MLNEFRLAGLRQPQVRETDGGTTHTGLQGIILCGIGMGDTLPSDKSSPVSINGIWSDHHVCVT